MTDLAEYEKIKKRHRRGAPAVELTLLWRSRLILTEKGNPKPMLANAMTALREAPEWQDVLGFDEFAQRTMLRVSAPLKHGATLGEWTTAHDTRLAEWMQREGINVSADVAAQAVDAVSRERPFHPVRNYLKGLTWDGKHRLDRWAVDYLGAEDTPYTKAAASRWMISAVARITEPGCKADCAAIFEGPQGALKSTALKALGTPWFTDEITDLGTKDAAMQLAGVWILELAELDSLSRSGVAKIKAFMSRTTDHFRPPYGHRVVDLPRQCVFAGTVNHTEYLRDETGGRRFWPIACGLINVDGLTGARDQLWAEARDRYLAGEPWWLDTIKLNTDAREAQRARYQPDAWQEPIAEHVALLDSVSVVELLREVIKLPIDKQGQTEMNRVARCLRALGWERNQEREGSRRVWRYRPPSPMSPDAESEPVT